MKKLMLKIVGIALLGFYFLGCDNEEITNDDPKQASIMEQFVTRHVTYKEEGKRR